LNTAQNFGAGCWVGNSPNRFFSLTLCSENLSSGENRAAVSQKIKKSLIVVGNWIMGSK